MEKIFKQYFYLTVFITAVLIAGAWMLQSSGGDYQIALFFSLPAAIGFFIGYIKYFNEAGLSKVVKNILKVMAGLVVLSLLLMAFGQISAVLIILLIPFVCFSIMAGFNVGFIIARLDEKRRGAIL
ncbi:hypothetical protein F3J23_14040 [Chryseobacterium sp. Tr-659]|uniref:hypothetical protein n=1 Tax=Chryseobacterium sp. Tr-659 TaxID=2608340 RepID=UPI001424A63F|nr:hypothetical protein [Chryseobacterium sp. Tr-659]NIF06565.1 hypothetical protein [Chryseobacterium sp. Tr-659]